MRRSLILAAASFAALVALPGTGAAQDNGPFYRAELAAPAPAEQVIASGTLWRCSETRCAAPKGRSRDVVACKRLAAEAGEVKAFVAGGVALDEAALAKCNG